jgi:hypothetical protein
MNAVPMLMAETEAQNAVILLSIFAYLAVVVAFWTFVGRWAYRDAQKRGRSGGWVAALVILFFPLGWVAWLALRPPVVPIAPVKLRFSRGPMPPSHPP